MGIKLPRLTWDLDCAPLGYPGIVFTLWLNPPQEVAREAEERAEKMKGRFTWDTPFLRTLEIVVDRILVPGEHKDEDGRSHTYTDDGEDIVIEMPTTKDLYELQEAEGFDPSILVWVAARYQDHRMERLRAAAKN